MSMYFDLAIYRHVNRRGQTVMVPLPEMDEATMKAKKFELKKAFYGLTARQCTDLHAEVINYRGKISETELLSRLEALAMAA